MEAPVPAFALRTRTGLREQWKPLPGKDLAITPMITTTRGIILSPPLSISLDKNPSWTTAFSHRESSADDRTLVQPHHLPPRLVMESASEQRSPKRRRQSLIGPASQQQPCERKLHSTVREQTDTAATPEDERMGDIQPLISQHKAEGCCSEEGTRSRSLSE